jgi:CRP-like cAMP-binding protein
MFTPPEIFLSGSENGLVALLPRKSKASLLALCEGIDMAFADVLCEAGQLTAHVYFPKTGFVSLIALTADSPALEVGMVGCEGMLGVQVALGALVSPLRAVVQGEGEAWQISATAFRRELRSNVSLQAVMQRYVCVLIAQLTISAGCLRFHLIGQRLARWLLMSQDRAGQDHFRVTHAFLAYMLGVRRVGITDAAGDLQRSGLIEHRRGELTVIDRVGLEGASCACHSNDLHSYKSLMGALTLRT